MKCELCKGETIIERGRRYHYTACGLENVCLENIDLCQRATDMALPVNPHKPARYTYRPESELAYA